MGKLQSFIPVAVMAVASALHRAGATSVCLVGGAIVDAFQGRSAKDWDLEVFGLSLQTIESTLEGYEPKEVGKSFGILKLNPKKVEGIELDVSVPRKDNCVGIGHRDFDVLFDSTMSVEEACRRRDFTINAMALDVFSGQLIDPFGGYDDLLRGVLRATDDTLFPQDGIRALRAFQLSARKCPIIHGHTAALITQMARPEVFESLARDRIKEELCKLLLKAEKPSIGLRWMAELGWVDLFPGLRDLLNTPQNPVHHPEGDVWTHTLLVVDAMAQLIRKHSSEFDKGEQFALMLAALLHDVGKQSALQEDLSAPGHDQAGVPLATQFMNCVTDDVKLTERVVALTGCHMRPYNLVSSEARNSRWEVLKKDLQPATLKMAGMLSRADWVGSAPWGQRSIEGVDSAGSAHMIAGACWAAEERLNIAKPLVGGKQLQSAGLKPGPAFKVGISAAYQAQLDDPSLGIEQLTEIAVKAAVESGR